MVTKHQPIDENEKWNEKESQQKVSSDNKKQQLIKILTEEFESYINSLKDIKWKTLPDIWQDFLNYKKSIDEDFTNY